MTLILPFPPTTGNHQHITARNGQRFLRKDVLDWRDIVCSCVSQVAERFYNAVPIEVTIDAYMPDNRKRDLDNIAKICNDALQEANMIMDDSSIHALHLYRRGVDKIAPRLIVTICKI